MCLCAEWNCQWTRELLVRERDIYANINRRQGFEAINTHNK